MSDKTGIIKINETAEKYIQAVSAKLHLQIEGENFFYGNAALEKSAEVKSLVESLKQAGIGAENVMIKDVSLQTEAGIFSKSSKATYKIAVNVKDLGLMSEALGAITGQKNCQLISTEWTYDEDEARIELARQALIKAKRKADSMAEAVGYKIVGIKECSDTYQEMPKQPYNYALIAQQSKSRGGFSMGSADIGTEFQNENKVSAQVFVEFIIEKGD